MNWKIAVKFFVPGLPRPGGSKKGFVVTTKSGKQRAVVVDAGGKTTKEWRQQVSGYAKDYWYDRPLITCPIKLEISFYMPRPKSHYRIGKCAHLLRDDAPDRYHTKKPDATKLVRSTEDAMTHIVWLDDSQVTWQIISKEYTQPGYHRTDFYPHVQKPGAHICVMVPGDAYVGDE